MHAIGSSAGFAHYWQLLLKLGHFLKKLLCLIKWPWVSCMGSHPLFACGCIGLGLCLGWKGQWICWREGREGKGGWGREGGEGTEGGWGERVGRGCGGEREGGERLRGRVGERGRVGRGRGGEREGGERGSVGERGRVGRGGEGGRGGERRGRGGMTVIHIVIGMFTSNPMIPRYLNNNLT